MKHRYVSLWFCVSFLSGGHAQASSDNHLLRIINLVFPREQAQVLSDIEGAIEEGDPSLENREHMLAAKINAIRGHYPRVLAALMAQMPSNDDEQAALEEVVMEGLASALTRGESNMNSRTESGQNNFNAAHVDLNYLRQIVRLLGMGLSDDMRSRISRIVRQRPRINSPYAPRNTIADPEFFAPIVGGQENQTSSSQSSLGEGPSPISTRVLTVPAASGKRSQSVGTGSCLSCVIL